jgi:hypothetical protein
MASVAADAARAVTPEAASQHIATTTNLVITNPLCGGSLYSCDSA